MRRTLFNLQGGPCNPYAPGTGGVVIRGRLALTGLGFVVACLACAWFGFWFGFSEMFFIHVDGRYTSDAAELLTQRHLLRCLEEDPKKAEDHLKDSLVIQRRILEATPQSVGWIDRVNVIVDPRAMWLILQQRQGVADTRVRISALALEDSWPGKFRSRGIERSGPRAREDAPCF